MKKFLAILLTLAMVLSMAIVVSADAPEGYELGQLTKANFGSSGWNSSYDSATSTITFNGAWVGRGWWIGTDNPMTGYDSMVIEFPGAEINAQVVVNYVGTTSVSDTYAINKGATSVTVTLDPDVGISQIYIQSKEEGTLTLGDAYMHEPVATPEFDCAVIFDNSKKADVDNDNVYIYIEASPVEWEESLVLKVVNANGDVLVQSQRNPSRDKFFSNYFGASIFAYGECTDGWLQNTWTPDANNAPYAVQLWVDGIMVDEEVISTEYDWSSSIANGKTMVGNAPTTGTYTGYFPTSEDTHAVIVGDAIITSNHEFDANGNCIYCGHHKELEEDEVVIETPVESTEEEVDTDDTEDTVDVEEKEDTNPTTGIALAVLPMMVAAAVVVASKRR